MGILVVCFIVLTSLPLLVTSDNATIIDDSEMGMDILYDMVKVFLGDVVHKEDLAHSFINLSTLYEDGKFDSSQLQDWRKWAEYLIGFAVCVAIGIVFIVVMPIVGLIFCCCRCCGRCGAKPGKDKLKKAKCKRISYFTVLVILNTIALAGVICAFICNSLVYKHLQNDNNAGALGHINRSFHNVEQFINNTVQEASAYVLDKYDTTSNGILKDVNDSASEAVDKVLNQLNVTNLLNEAKGISQEVNETQKHLVEVSDLLSNLSDDTNQLKDNLTKLRNDLEAVCNQTICAGFNASEYRTDADFSALKNLSEEAKNISEALTLYEYITEAEKTMNKAINEAKGQVSDNTNEAENAIRNIRKQISDGTDDLKSKSNNILKDFPTLKSNANEDVEKYSSYVYYGGIAVCCVYLLIMVLYYIGLMFGLCGEQPGHGAPCCNTGCGANFLIVGVVFTFIFSWILMIICVVLFATGGPAYTEVCRYFEGHDPSQLKYFDDIFIKGLKKYYNRTDFDISIPDIVRECQKNTPIYSAFKLDNLVDLDHVMNLDVLQQKLDQLKQSTVTVSDIKILSDDMVKDLQNVVNSVGNFNFTDYHEELRKKLTVANLTKLADNVAHIASNEPDPNKKTTLEDFENRLRILDKTTVASMTSKVTQLNSALHFLEDKKAIKEQITTLIEHLNASQINFNTNKTALISNQISALADRIFDQTNNSITEVKRDIREKKFGGQALSTALYTISDSVCVLILNPVNGLWFSFGWCLFFFVFNLIFAVLLAAQYQRKLEDDKDFDLYAGHSNDTIPLTSVDQSHRNGAHKYQQPSSGMSNAAYRDDGKLNPYTHPPLYDDHMHQGGWTGDIPEDQGRMYNTNRGMSNGRNYC